MQDNTLTTIQAEANQIVNDWYADGVGLKSTKLKNFTSGDKKKNTKIRMVRSMPLLARL